MSEEIVKIMRRYDAELYLGSPRVLAAFECAGWINQAVGAPPGHFVLDELNRCWERVHELPDWAWRKPKAKKLIRLLELTPILESPARKKRRYQVRVSLRLYILERDNRTCRYCGDPANSVDHVIPFSAGGADCEENLVAACMDCNRRKRNRSKEEFLLGR